VVVGVSGEVVEASNGAVVVESSGEMVVPPDGAPPAAAEFEGVDAPAWLVDRFTALLLPREMAPTMANTTTMAVPEKASTPRRLSTGLARAGGGGAGSGGGGGGLGVS
jgi:hypothetical protein